MKVPEVSLKTPLEDFFCLAYKVLPFFTRRRDELSIVCYVMDLPLMPRSSSGHTLAQFFRRSHEFLKVLSKRLHDLFRQNPTSSLYSAANKVFLEILSKLKN